MKRSEVFVILLLIGIGLFLRLFFLKDLAITFGFDQARDAYQALAITQGDIKILGPSASTPGLYHGVLYYYLLAPSYLLGQGNPVVTNIWLSIINILTLFPIFLLGKLLFNNKVGFLAAFLFAISFDAVQYANWMSNPAPAVLSGALFYLGLAYFIFNKKFKTPGLILTALGLGLSTQFEVFLGYLFVPLLISLFVFKIKPTIGQTALFFIVFILTISSMILSYIKFGPTFIAGFANLYGSGGDPFGAWRQFSPTLELYLDRFAEYFYRGLLPFNVAIAGALGFLIVGLSIKWSRSQKSLRDQLTFLLIMLFSHGFLIPFGGTSTPFINAGLEAIVLVIVALFIYKLFETKKLVAAGLIILIILSCIYAIFKYNPQGQTVFAIQRGLTLKNELAAVDYTYKQANGQPFSVNTITSPLWINTVWAYLYNWYGMKKYGYIPSFYGRDQAGYLGSLPDINKQDQVIFLIQEPLAGIPVRFAQDTIAYVDSFSEVVASEDFTGIIVQKRKFTKPFKEINFVK